MATETIVTKQFRLAFPAVFTPEKAMNPGAPDKYAVTMLFVKGTDLSDLKSMVQAAIEEKWPNKDKRPKDLKLPFRDGDEKDWAGFEGHVFARASSQYRPGVVNQKVQKVLDEEEIYGGCYCRAEINAFAFDSAGNRGVAFGLSNLQKVADGERFGGKKDPEKVFAPVEGNGADNPENYGGGYDDPFDDLPF